MSRAGAVAVSRSGTAAAGQALPLPPGYLERSQRPFISLVFLLPLVVVYEVGTRSYLTDPQQGTQQIVAFTLLQQFFQMFGANGRHLPALAVGGILLAWHIARKDSWRVGPGTLIGMAVESVILVLPLFVIGFLLARFFPPYPPLAATVGIMDRVGLFQPPPGDQVVLSLGAGIYEELVFRLILCTVLSMIFKDVLRMPKDRAYVLLVLISAVLFSSYHYLGPEPFLWRNFAFRALAGIYFAALFLIRGFGVTAGSHAAYDVAILVI